MVYAEWHPRLWDTWNTNFEFFTNHPTANLLTVNSLLQLGLSEFLFDGTDLSPEIIINKPEREQRTLAIVPSTKLAGRPTPHPGCDGKGFRFNGDNGLSWINFCDRIRELDSTIKIVEFSYENFGWGDEHVPHKEDWFLLANECAKPTVAVMSDGGMHHVFTTQKTPIVLLGAQKINKPCFFKSGDVKTYDYMNKRCYETCEENIVNLSGWPDLGKTCTGACEEVDAIELANNVYRDYFS